MKYDSKSIFSNTDIYINTHITMSDFSSPGKVVKLIGRIQGDRRSSARRGRLLNKMTKVCFRNDPNFIERFMEIGGVQELLSLYTCKRESAKRCVVNLITLMIKFSQPVQILPLILNCWKAIMKMDEVDCGISLLPVLRLFLGSNVAIWAHNCKDLYTYFVLDFYKNADDAVSREIEKKSAYPIYSVWYDLPNQLGIIEKQIKENVDFINVFHSLMGSMSQLLKILDGRPAKDLEIFCIILEVLYRTADVLGESDSFVKLLSDRGDEFKGMVTRCVAEYGEYDWLHYNSWVVQFLKLNKDEKHVYALLILPSINIYNSYRMLINRNNALHDSVCRLRTAQVKQLRSNLNIIFVGEEGRGIGLRREWFSITLEELLKKRLLVSYSEDLRRILPTRECIGDADIFRFAGQLIALALLNKVSLGVSLDKVLYLCLAESEIRADDLKNTDPELYMHLKNCTKIENSLCADEKRDPDYETEISDVDDKKEAMKRFLKSVESKISWMKSGFDDVVGSLERKRFFKSIEYEILNNYLLGDQKEISIEDWKSHTDYNGYEKGDDRIIWFWQVLADMSPEERRDILYFWTSFKFLPPEGFGGLPMRLCIAQIQEPEERYPSSSTCFCLLKLPPYSSIDVMRDRLQRIRKEHTCFGLR